MLVNGGTGAHVLATGQLVYLHDRSLFGVPFNARTSKSRALRSCSPKMCRQRAAASLVFPLMERLSTHRSPSSRPAHWSGWTVKGARIRFPLRLAAISIHACHRTAHSWLSLHLRIFGFGSSPLNALMRLTFTQGAEYNPAWMPDGRRVVFDANEGGVVRILRKAADGTGATDVVVPSPAGYPETVSPDGKFLVYHTVSSATDPDALALGSQRPGAAAGSRKTQTQTLNAEISPDGHWIAYQSDESGRFEIYVHPFPALETGRWQVSFTGGSHPLWARDGRELLFINGAGTLVSESISAGEGFAHGPSVSLFPAGQYYVEFARNYDVSVDGTRFVFVKNLSSATRPSLVVVSRWLDEVRAKMGAK